jgi:hypothetical protein
LKFFHFGRAIGNFFHLRNHLGSWCPRYVARTFRYCCQETRYFCSSYIINEGRMDKVFSFCFSPSLSRITSNFSTRDAFWCLYFF